MASKHIGSIAVGVEASYGSVANGVPGALALSSAFVSMELADRAQITPYGDTVATERKDARDGFYGVPPEAVGSTAAGTLMRRAKITLDAWVRSIGGPVGAIATYPGMPLYRLLRTRFDEHLPAIGASDPVAAPLGTVAGFAPTVAGDYTIGEILRIVTAAAPAMSRYTTVTDKTAAPLIVVSPELDVAPPVASVVYPLPTLHIPRAGSTSLLTCALRINGANYQYDCFGVVMESLTVTGVSDDGRAVRVSIGLDASWVFDNDAGFDATAILPEVVSSGSICHSLAADVVISDVLGTTAPETAARTALPACLDAWTLKVTWTMNYPGCGLSWLGRSTPEAVDMDVELEMILAEYDAGWDLAADFGLRRQRSVLLGFSGGDNGPGEGGAVFIPAAYQKVDGFKPTTDGETLRQRLVYGAGRYSGDDDTTTLANSILRIALG